MNPNSTKWCKNADSPDACFSCINLSNETCNDGMLPLDFCTINYFVDPCKKAHESDTPGCFSWASVSSDPIFKNICTTDQFKQAINKPPP